VSVRTIPILGDGSHRKSAMRSRLLVPVLRALRLGQSLLIQRGSFVAVADRQQGISEVIVHHAFCNDATEMVKILAAGYTDLEISKLNQWQRDDRA
jgi:hypothetical protein